LQLLQEALLGVETPVGVREGHALAKAFVQPLLEASHERQQSLEEFAYWKKNIDWSKDRLEQKNLLTRADHPTDRRVYVLDLTRGGRALVEELQAIRLSAMEDVLAGMTVADRRRVISGLETLVDAAARVSRGES